MKLFCIDTYLLASFHQTELPPDNALKFIFTALRMGVILKNQATRLE